MGRLITTQQFLGLPFGNLFFFDIWMYLSLLITNYIIGGEMMPPHKGLGHVNQMNLGCS